MTDTDILNFLTTMGHVFCNILHNEAGIEDASGHDCYSAMVAALGGPVGLDELRAVKPEQFTHIADAFNRYFETTTVQPSHIAKAISKTLWHWS